MSLRPLILRAEIAFALCFVFLPACQPTTSHDVYQVPEEHWSVSVSPAPHIGPPSLTVRIAEEFSWPEAVGDPPQPVHYRVELLPPDGDVVENVGELTEEERFSVVLTAPQWLVEELDLDLEAEEANRESTLEEDEAFIEDLASSESISQETLNWLENQQRRYRPEHDLEERAQIFENRVRLVPFAGDRGLARQNNPGRTPAAPRYTWGTEVEEEDDPCNGGTPEECARDRIRDFLRRLCEEENEDGTARFPTECARLRAKLEATPPGPVVECTIPAEVGVTAGVTDANTGKITLNGEELLSGDCAEATILHELRHALDFEPDDAFRDLKEFDAAEDRMQQAIEDFRAAREAGDAAAERRARDALVRAQLDIQRLEQAAGREMLEAECNALFATIDNADLFEYPGEGNAWMKENLKGMIGELPAIRHLFNLPRKTEELCTCFRRIQSWAGTQDVIARNFRRDLFDEGQDPPISWMQALNGLVTVYCP